MKKVIIFLSFMVLSGSMANAVVMNFDDLEVAGTGEIWLTEYSAEGFQITTDRNLAYNLASYQQSSEYYEGSASLWGGTRGIIMTLSSVDGSTFDLNSIDLDQLRGVFTDPIDVTFQAFDSEGALIDSDTATVTSAGWNTHYFSTSFVGISSVVWQHGTMPSDLTQFDNIVLNETQSSTSGDGAAPVPEPSTMILFGAGLIGLVGYNKRKRSSFFSN